MDPFFATKVNPFCRLLVVADSVADKDRVRSGQQHTCSDKTDLGCLRGERGITNKIVPEEEEKEL